LRLGVVPRHCSGRARHPLNRPPALKPSREPGPGGRTRFPLMVTCSSPVRPLPRQGKREIVVEFHPILVRTKGGFFGFCCFLFSFLPSSSRGAAWSRRDLRSPISNRPRGWCEPPILFFFFAVSVFFFVPCSFLCFVFSLFLFVSFPGSSQSQRAPKITVARNIGAHFSQNPVWVAPGMCCLLAPFFRFSEMGSPKCCSPFGFFKLPKPRGA